MKLAEKKSSIKTRRWKLHLVEWRKKNCNKENLRPKTVIRATGGHVRGNGGRVVMFRL